MNNIEIFTDGGCSGNPGPGGWAYVILFDGQEKAVSGGDADTTNNRMELTAVISALKDINSMSDWRTRPIVVHTDSQYVKNGISQWITNWKRNGWVTAAKKSVKNKELWMELDFQAETLQVDWKWVKGHAGNTYNELCDSLVGVEMKKFK